MTLSCAPLSFSEGTDGCWGDVELGGSANPLLPLQPQKLLYLSYKLTCTVKVTLIKNDRRGYKQDYIAR